MMHQTLRSLLFLFAFLPLVAAAQTPEDCANGWDDDWDGLTDLQDTTDCGCLLVVDTVAVTSIIPNSSFECYTSLPTGISQLNNSCGWVQATTPTTDYFVNIPPGYFPPIVPTPLPAGGDACVGAFFADGWQEYLGATLLGPMTAGTSYTLNVDVAAAAVDGGVATMTPIFFGPVDICIYGVATPQAFPLATTGCPVPLGWTLLGCTTYNPVWAWNTVTITFTPPFDIAQVIIGSPCVLPPGFAWTAGYAPYIYFDELTLNQTSAFNGSTIQVISTDSLAMIQGTPIVGDTNMVTSYCFTNIELLGHVDSAGATYQWYYEDFALVGETDSVLHWSSDLYWNGTYQMVATYPTGCVYSEIAVNENPIYPVPELSASVTSGCAPLAVQFSNDTDPSLIGSSIWDFGDGSPLDTTTNPMHVYPDSGTYTITLTVYSPLGCMGDTIYTSYIHVDAAPVASFTLDTLSGCDPLTVNFTNTTDPAWFGSCLWNIGTGAPVAGCADFSYTYTTAGTYPVTLVVTSPGGCPSPPAGPVNVVVHPIPQVLMSADVYDGCSPLAVAFNNDTDPANTDSCWWDLGNAIVAGDCGPLNTYPATGVYDVTLTVTSPFGCVGTATTDSMITVYGHPQPDFTAMPDSGCYPLEVNFNNTTDPAMLASSDWLFGDGGGAHVNDPTYTYVGPGIFDVTLTVTSPEGCEGDTIFPQYITVFDHPVADFLHTPQPTDVFEPEIDFHNTSTADVVEWDWSFGEFGSLGASTDTNPVFTFPDQVPGEYPVQLIVTNFNGCMDTVEYTVVIDPYFSVYVPNSFTPDGDGFNDYFQPVMKDDVPEAFKMYIYDRWGTKVYESTDRYNAWIGTYMNNGGEPLPQGVYVWRIITAPAIDQKVRKEFMGHVSLLK